MFRSGQIQSVTYIIGQSFQGFSLNDDFPKAAFPRG